MGNSSRQICEFGSIWNARDWLECEDSLSAIYLDTKSFENLKCFVAENNDPSTEIESAFTYHRQKGKDCIRVKNYVGVIETRNGTTIEILPKIYTSKTQNTENAIHESRSILISMLRCLQDSPFKTIDQAHINSDKMPILEIFISEFLQEVENVLNKGIKHFYSSSERNLNFLKGRLLFNEQLKRNMVRADLFFVRFDEFKANIPQNRVLKTALYYVSGKTKSSRNKTRIKELLALLEEVEFSKNISSDLAKLNGHNRLFNYYDSVLKWSRLFLEGKSFTNFKGKFLNTAILFPMEVLFEAFVAHKLKKIYPEFDISTQDRQYYLLTDLLLKQNKFRIRPDLVIKNEDSLIIADTKWKVLDQNQSNKNYLISQADMYQLYAYGKKYNSGNLILIYPECETFTQELLFEYDNNLQLRCIPWSFRKENQILLTQSTMTITKEPVFTVLGEGGLLEIVRKTEKNKETFTFSLDEMDPTNEGLDVKYKIEYATFDESLQRMDRYPWPELQTHFIHPDFQDKLIKKLLEKLNKDQMSTDSKNRLRSIEEALNIQLIYNETYGWSFTSIEKHQ